MKNVLTSVDSRLTEKKINRAREVNDIGGGGLVDSYGRKHDYLRLSVTDKCNLRCRYCMPPHGVANFPHNEVLRNEEFLNLLKIFSGLGVTKIRFTGGEPLVRRGFIDLLSEVRKKLPATVLSLTTNGILLSPFISVIKDIGIRNINISLDTLSRDRYIYLCGRDELFTVKSSFEKTIAENFFNLKVNLVLFEETIHELDTILDYYHDTGVTLRFIEQMPLMGGSGLSFVGSDMLLEALKSRGSLSRDVTRDTKVACMYDFLYKGLFRMKIGVIPPLTHKFCSRCNRIRLTCNGSLKTCLLGNELFDLRGPVRNGAGDQEIVAIIQAALLAKPLGHNLDCISRGDECASLSSMSVVGG